MNYGYCRVSHVKSYASGLGLEAQREMIARYAAFKGLSDVVYHAEPKATSAKIPFLQRAKGRALDAGLRPGDHVIFSKGDRAFRNARECLVVVEGWQARGITVHFAHLNIDCSTALGKLFMTILAAFSEWELAIISERICEALARKRERGWRPNQNRLRLGYRWQVYGKAGKKRRMIPCPKEMAVLRLIYRWRSQGWSRETVHAHLNWHCRRCSKCRRFVSDPPGATCGICGQKLLPILTRKGKSWGQSAIETAYHTYREMLANGEVPNNLDETDDGY